MRLSLILCLLMFIEDNFQLCDAAPTLDSDENPTSKDEDDKKKYRESFAQRMKSFMNTSVNPCDDFYVMISVCNNAQHWPQTPSEEYLNVLRSIGGFPALYPTWNVSSFDWFNMTAHLIRYGVVGLIREEIFLKHPFPPYYEIPRFGFDFDVYSDNIRTNESLGYRHNVKIMKDLLNLYGVNSTESDEVIKEVIEFWKEALVYQDKALDRRSCRRLSLEDDLDEYEFPKWKSLFEIAWQANNFSIFDDCDCPCDWYFKKLNDLSANRSKAMANYMALKFLYKMHAQLKSTKFQRQYCICQIKHTMPLILTYFYMKEHFRNEDQKEVEEIIVELKASFIRLIESSDWLDDESRIGNQMTINTLKARVGEIVDPISDIFIREIKMLNLTENYAANNLELAKFRVDMHHYAFLQPDLDKNTSPLDVLNAIQVNAFYDLMKHGINVLAGILFPPVYHKYLPNSVKYGGLGYIVGHEIVHSLDYRGRKFEKLFKNHSTWSEESAQMAHNRSQCFADHHSNYIVPILEQKINRTKNTKESIADSGGLRQAFETYRTIYKVAVKNKIKYFEQMETLPGLDHLTPDATFFLSFAQIYCAKYEAKHYWSEIYEDHPMDRYRVISSLQNFEEFSVAYNCSLGTPMNPNKKCRLW